MADKNEANVILCPQCHKKVNKSGNRLVQDACGHRKCRICLLNEESGCALCLGQEQGASTVAVSEVIYVAGSPIDPQEKKVMTRLESLAPSPSSSTSMDQDPLSVAPCSPATSDKTTDTDTKKTLKPKRTLYIPSHIIVSDSDPKYSCTICKKSFTAKLNVRYHLYCDGMAKPYKCDICFQEFASKSHFEYHVRNHEGKRPFSCTKCKKSFNQQGKLTRHVKTHSTDRPFVCTTCGSSFRTSESLKSHSRAHSGDKPYNCNICKMKFAEGSNLKKHAAIHSGLKNYMCDECGKSFSLRSTLNMHTRTHTRVRPHACTMCFRGFTSVTDLRRHSATHSNFRPFSCPLCNQAFRRRDNYDRHMKNTHSESHLPPTILKPSEYSENQIETNSPISKPLSSNFDSNRGLLIERSSVTKIKQDIVVDQDKEELDICKRAEDAKTFEKQSICEKPVLSINNVEISSKSTNIQGNNELSRPHPLNGSNNDSHSMLNVSPVPHIRREPIINTLSPSLVTPSSNLTCQAVPVISSNLNSSATSPNIRYNTPSIIQMGSKVSQSYEGTNCVPTITRTSNAVAMEISPNVPTIVSPPPVQNQSTSLKNETAEESATQKPTLRLYLSDVHWRKRTMELLNLRNKLKADSLVYDKSLEKVSDVNEERIVLNNTPPTCLELNRSPQLNLDDHGKYFFKQTLYNVPKSHGESQQMYLPHNRLRHRLPKSIDVPRDRVSNIHHTGENTRLITLANVAATHIQEVVAEPKNVIVENVPQLTHLRVSKESE